MKIKSIIIVLLFIAIEIFPQSSGSFGTGDSRSSAMGNTFTAVSRGVYAIGKNPANLAYSYNNTVEFSTVLPFLNLNLGIGNDFITVDDYNYFFDNGWREGGKEAWSNQDKADFKSLFDDGNTINADLSLTLFSIAVHLDPKIGNFGLAVYDKAAMRFGFPTELVDFVTDGNEPGRTYNLDDMDISSSYLRYFSFSYARNLNELLEETKLNKFIKSASAGLTLNIVQGYHHSKLEYFNTKITTDPNNYSITVQGDMLMNAAFSSDFGLEYDFEEDTTKEENFGIFPSPAGTGFGIDFGLSAEINDVWTVGLAITDIGSISWDNETVAYTTVTTQTFDDITDEEVVDSLVDNIKGEGNYSDGYDSDLPTALRIGAAFRLDRFLKGNFPGEMIIAIDYNQGFNDEASNTTEPRVSVGAEWKPIGWYALRTGFSGGGAEAFKVTGGMGFDTGWMEINIGTTYLHSIFMGNSIKRFGINIGSRFRI